VSSAIRCRVGVMEIRLSISCFDFCLNCLSSCTICRPLLQRKEPQRMLRLAVFSFYLSFSVIISIVQSFSLAPFFISFLHSSLLYISRSLCLLFTSCLLSSVSLSISVPLSLPFLHSLFSFTLYFLCARILPHDAK
jgi:hypothetical protein